MSFPLLYCFNLAFRDDVEFDEGAFGDFQTADCGAGGEVFRKLLGV